MPESTTDAQHHSVLDHTVLVTGSSRGIGAAVAFRLARDGCNVVIHCRQATDQAQAVQKRIRALDNAVACRILCFDVTDRAACRSILEEDIATYGTYYGVVCNAGLANDAAFPAMTGQQWDDVVHTNLDAFYNVLAPLVMPMVRRRKPGRIVTMSSVSGLIGNRGQTNYAAAKAGIIGATKSLAIELAKRDITVNCVAPGLIETDMIEAAPIERIRETIPLRRVGTPDEVAALVSFLISAESSYITRQVIAVNGGMC